MKRILLTAVLVALAFFAGRAIYLAMASDQTRIGWLFAAEAEAFNSTSAFSVLSHFALDYRDDTVGFDLQMLRGAVLWVFQQHGDPEQPSRWHVELPEAAGSVTVAGDTASAELPLRLYGGRDADAKLLWEVKVTAQLRRVDGDWRIARSTHATTQGRMPDR